MESLGPKETAVEIRKLLKAKFPATKFSVRTSRGSMVSAVDIRWTDGPTTYAVAAITSCFQAGHFDGMVDGYEYDRTSFLRIDGVTYRPGCRYVSTERTISARLANRCIAQIAEYWGIENPPVATDTTYGGYELPADVGRRAVRSDMSQTDDWYTMIYRAASDRTRFAHTLPTEG